MAKRLTPERKALLDECVREGWPLIEMWRTHRIHHGTVRRHHPDYHGISDKAEQGRLGNAQRQLTLSIRRNHPQPARA